MKILGLDYGDTRIGIAISDPFGWMAQSAGIISEKDKTKHINLIKEKIKEHAAEKIVLGFPKNMNGTVGERGELTQSFAKELEEETGLEVVLWDERLSSVSAHRTLSEAGISGKKRKGKVDSLAAAFILQGYLDSVK